MASSWKTAASGDWSNAADWTGGVPNDAATAATIGVPGLYTVTIAKSEGFTVGTLSLNSTSATLRIDGTLTVANTFQLTSGTLYLDGTLKGGTIAATGGKTKCMGGTLIGVSYQGTLDLSEDNSSLTITGGTTFAGAGGAGVGTINFDNKNDFQTSTLYVSGTQTLDNVTISLGHYGTAGQNSIENYDATGAGAILTLGSKTTIVHTDTSAALTSSGDVGDMIVNNGAINATFKGGHLYIDADHFTNNGKITVTNGDSLDLTGNAITAGLINSIKTSGGIVSIDGTVTGGTITAPTGGVGGHGGTLIGVSYQGTLDLSADNSSLTITGGTTFAGAGGAGVGTINFDNKNDFQTSTLYVSGTQTLDNVTISLGHYGTAGQNSIENYDATGAGAILTLGSKTTIVHTDTSAALTRSSDVGDMIVNNGAINATFKGGTFYIAVANFINRGSITATNGDTLILKSTSQTVPEVFNNKGGVTANGGVLQVLGSVIGKGSLTVAGTGSIEIAGAAASTQKIAFASGATGTIKLDTATKVKSTITGFTTGDTIDVAGLAATSASYASGVLTIFNGSQKLASLAIASGGSTSNYHLASDGKGGTNITFVASPATVDHAGGGAAATLAPHGFVAAMATFGVPVGGGHQGLGGPENYARPTILGLPRAAIA